ncbi:MAG: CpsB/CapC family capsule biosynthesis tyrosine phosphatase [Eubacterium sp.]
MLGIIDIHTHMLPKLDDGAKDMEETMQMLQQSYEQGVRGIIFTPHYHKGHFEADSDKILKTFESVKEKSGRKWQDLKLYLGREIYYNVDVPDMLADGRLQTMAESMYVLVEFPIDIEYALLKDNINSILLAGKIPVIAHAERYKCLYKKQEYIESIVKMGAYIQVNASGFTKSSPWKTRRFIMKLFKNDMVHLVASDAHGSKTRKPDFYECERILVNKYGIDYAEYILKENPEKIISNQYI